MVRLVWSKITSDSGNMLTVFCVEMSLTKMTSTTILMTLCQARFTARNENPKAFFKLINGIVRRKSRYKINTILLGYTQHWISHYLYISFSG